MDLSPTVSERRDIAWRHLARESRVVVKSGEEAKSDGRCAAISHSDSGHAF